MSSADEVEVGILTDSLSKPIGELLLAAESVDADLEWWLIIANGGGEQDEVPEGVGDTESL